MPVYLHSQKQPFYILLGGWRRRKWRLGISFLDSASVSPVAAVSDSKLKNPVNREDRKLLSHGQCRLFLPSKQGFPQVFISIQTWKNDGNTVAVKGTLRYDCEQKGGRWRLSDAYLGQTGAQTDLIPVLAASSRHTQTWVQLCLHVYERDLSTCDALLLSLPLLPLHQILILLPLC